MTYERVSMLVEKKKKRDEKEIIVLSVTSLFL
jgi:hypothetical protein